ncbi:MAG TPA: wax ester/triacylglycerol synthase family O-acyltransferase [Acidimicrobiales bacterium]|nr:wax ester/triacylglycerol synthase family O-acyltransferase [Acidimicrobiales bacterium]
MDASFLYLETPSVHMHVGGVFVFDGKDLDRSPYEAISELIESRLHLLPPFRRRLVEVPFGLHHPIWIEDPDFQLSYHLRSAALPAPGGENELAQFAADIMSRQLDRTRPLWETYVVEGLRDGMFAFITKTHHAAIDGVSGAELAVNLLDLTPEIVEVPQPEEPWIPDKVPTDFEMVSHAMRSLSRQPFSALKAFRRTVEVALNVRERNRQPGVNPPPGPFSAPKTSLNGTISAHRRISFTDISLDEVKLVKNTFGGTVNDVVLAVCSGALKAYLEDRGEMPEESLVAAIPISVRTEDEKGTLGNRVSAMLASLATAIDDPVKRYAAICEGTRSAKEQDQAVGAASLTEWAEFASPAIAGRAARMMSNVRVFDKVRPLFNVTVSNVPGPNFPLYSVGSKMVAMYPMGPIMDGIGLNITVMSYMGRMHFGLLGCWETVPRIDSIGTYLNESLAELVKEAEKATGKARKAKAAATSKRTSSETSQSVA